MAIKTVDLASQLVAIPSYVSAACNEQELVDYLAGYAKDNLPQLAVTQSPIGDKGRSNLYLLGKKQPRVVFLGHVDTVQPSGAWASDPLAPIVRNDRLYGLGVADMKGSIASLLIALQDSNPALLDEVAVILYVDEEYQFAGMKQLIADKIITSKNQPELIVSLDGGLSVLSGCRGLVKIEMEVIGKSGHSSDPANGINAITAIMDVMRALESKLPEYASDLGVSTMNVARLNGGAVSELSAPSDMQRTGNVIPNYAECIVELRTASGNLDAAKVEEILRAECAKRGLKVKSLGIGIDLGVWPGSLGSYMTDFIKDCYLKASIEYSEADSRRIGFIDVQMLAETVSSPIYVIGAGGENRHGANENVLIANLEKARNIYQIIIEQLGEYNGKK